MRLFKVEYYDLTFSARKERFATKPYNHGEALDVAGMLEAMGCTSVTVVPLEGAPKAAVVAV